ncbi:hypothetical protein N9Y42_07175 [Mariniblastus sp.]|nr:hypothetical protein [Mariniblastus sp.]
MTNLPKSQRLPQWIRFFILAICLFWFAESAAMAQSNSSIGNDDVIKAFKKRMEHARNLYYKCVITLEVYEDNNGVRGKLIARAPERYEYWQLNDSNRQEAIYKTDDGVDVTYGANFDAELGQGQSRSKSIGGERTMGYIDSKRDPTMSANRYRFWLNVRDWGHGSSEYIFNYVIDRKLGTTTKPEAILPNLTLPTF